VNRIKLFKLLLISLIIVAYQFNTTHLTHIIQEEKQCDICISKKQTKSTAHQISFVQDTNPLETLEIKRERVKKILTISLQPPIQSIDFLGMRHYQVNKIPLGYNSHAPPYNYS